MRVKMFTPLNHRELLVPSERVFYGIKQKTFFFCHDKLKARTEIDSLDESIQCGEYPHLTLGAVWIMDNSP